MGNLCVIKIKDFKIIIYIYIKNKTQKVIKRRVSNSIPSYNRVDTRTT